VTCFEAAHEVLGKQTTAEGKQDSQGQERPYQRLNAQLNGGYVHAPRRESPIALNTQVIWHFGTNRLFLPRRLEVGSLSITKVYRVNGHPGLQPFDVTHTACQLNLSNQL